MRTVSVGDGVKDSAGLWDSDGKEQRLGLSVTVVLVVALARTVLCVTVGLAEAVTRTVLCVTVVLVVALTRTVLSVTVVLVVALTRIVLCVTVAEAVGDCACAARASKSAASTEELRVYEGRASARETVPDTSALKLEGCRRRSKEQGSEGGRGTGGHPKNRRSSKHLMAHEMCSRNCA